MNKSFCKSIRSFRSLNEPKDTKKIHTEESQTCITVNQDNIDICTHESAICSFEKFGGCCSHLGFG